MNRPLGARALASSSENKSDLDTIKVVLVGDAAVGKSSLAHYFLQSEPCPIQYKPTVGLDIRTNTVLLPGDQAITVELWDVGGAALHSKSLPNYFFGAHAILFVYDVTNYMTFMSLMVWHKVFMDTRPSRLPKLALVGNKLDLGSARAIRKEDCDRFANDHNMINVSTSARTGDSVAALMTQVAAAVLNVPIQSSDLETPQNISKVIAPKDAVDAARPLSNSSNGNGACTLQ